MPPHQPRGYVYNPMHASVVDELGDDESSGEGDKPNEDGVGMVPDDEDGGGPATETGSGPAVPAEGPDASRPAVDNEKTDYATLG